MLDTGIDVPQVVNLVFAKPVFSWVKFWQMIGRGTRLCENLFGPGNHKKIFRIFDHWGNFDRFDIQRPEADPAPSKSIMQLVFEARINLAEIALAKGEFATLQQTIELIRADINSLPDDTIAVREKWKEKSSMLAKGVLDQFAPATVATLRNEIAPLMQWVFTRDHSEAYRFDLLVTGAELELLRGSGRLADFRDKIREQVGRLLMHLNPVRARAKSIQQVLADEFWEQADIPALEQMRQDLRGIMHYQEKTTPPQSRIKNIDVSDGDIQLEQRSTNIRSIDMQLYKQQVEATLEKLFDTSPVLQKIRRGEPVSEKDLNSLVSLVLTQNPDIDLELLREFWDSTAPLDFLIRRTVGMDAEAVEKIFADFARRFADNSRQTHFLRLLKNHIRKYGTITVDKLYEAPFTTIDSDGLDGVFRDERQVDELINLIRTFQPQPGTQPQS